MAEKLAANSHEKRLNTGPTSKAMVLDSFWETGAQPETSNCPQKEMQRADHEHARYRAAGAIPEEEGL